jgi:hypothetical protein
MICISPYVIARPNGKALALSPLSELEMRLLRALWCMLCTQGTPGLVAWIILTLKIICEISLSLSSPQAR